MHKRHSTLRSFLHLLRRLLRREPETPDDPYAYVGAPKKPRPPLRGARAAEPLE